MTFIRQSLDAEKWYDRWERMFANYDADRDSRFDLMLRWADFPHDAELRILDLGCGPGSLTFRALERYPNARVLAADADRVLLTIADGVARKRGLSVEFEVADFRRPHFWKRRTDPFDLIVTATTLHWLTPRHHKDVYKGIYRALGPGGLFFNSDHFAAENPRTQKRFRAMLDARRAETFARSPADDWTGYWLALTDELGVDNIDALRGAANIWEGTDDGQPKSFHRITLKRCGFDRIEFLWQNLGEAVLTARKPPA